MLGSRTRRPPVREVETEVVETELYEPGPPPFPPEEPPPSRELWPWLLVLLVLVLAIAGAAYYISDRNDNRAARATTTVVQAPVPPPAAPQVKKHKAKPLQPVKLRLPRLIGMKAPQAIATLRKLQLTGEVRGAFSTKPRGVVIAQTPKPGTKVAKNASVELQVSKGPRDIPVPDLVGQQRDDAVATLKAAGLKANVADIPSQEPEEVVIAQHPAAGAKAPADSAVRLNVSSGSPPPTAKKSATPAQPSPQPAQKTQPTTKPKPARQQPATPTPVTVTVPDLVGGTLASARSQLREGGLVTEIRRVPSQEPEDTVTGQSPHAGTAAKKGDHVFLTVSLGPTTQPSATQQGTRQAAQPVVPNVVGEDQATAAADLRAAGFKVSVLDQPTEDSSQDGVVIDQSPAATTKAAAGSTVTITVARASG